MRSSTPCSFALSLAISRASGDMSVAITRQPGRFLATAIAIAPEPVQMSAM